MAKPDLVTESSTFRAGNDNRASSNSLSSEAYDCMDKFASKSKCASEGVAGGARAKLGGGAAAAAGGATTKEMSKDASGKSDALESGSVLDKRLSVDDFSKDKNKDLDKNNKKDTESDHKKKDMCLDFNVEIKGYPNHQTSDERRTNHLNEQLPQRGEGGSRTVPLGREHLPPSSKIDQEYGQYLDKRDAKKLGN